MVCIGLQTRNGQSDACQREQGVHKHDQALPFVVLDLLQSAVFDIHTKYAVHLAPCTHV